MKIRVSPGKINGKLAANPSKSAMQRAVAAALLAKGTSTIHNPGISNDCLAALEVAQKLGAEIEKTDDAVHIKGNGVAAKSEKINCGESGLGIRMFTPIAALSDQKITIEAEGSLKTRPVDFFEEVLPKLQVSCQTENGNPPITIQGPLTPADISIDGSLSSQFLTGLLMAYASKASDETIHVRNLTSKPYIELTLDIMNRFGVKVEHDNLENFHFKTKQSYQPTEYTVEGDWSGAAFLLVAGAVGGNINVSHLELNSTQSDKAILEAIKKAGADLEITEERIIVRKSDLTAFEFDATQCPDLFPPIAALAANCEGTTVIKGALRLTHKESNRSVALEEEFGKMGIEIKTEGDLMYIKGGTGIKSAKVHSHFDHRIAMACAVAAINADGSIEIEVAESVNKSYPEFWKHWNKIGGEAEEVI